MILVHLHLSSTQSLVIPGPESLPLPPKSTPLSLTPPQTALKNVETDAGAKRSSALIQALASRAESPIADQTPAVRLVVASHRLTQALKATESPQVRRHQKGGYTLLGIYMHSHMHYNVTIIYVLWLSPKCQKSYMLPNSRLIDRVFFTQ